MAKTVVKTAFVLLAASALISPVASAMAAEDSANTWDALVSDLQRGGVTLQQGASNLAQDFSSAAISLWERPAQLLADDDWDDRYDDDDDDDRWDRDDDDDDWDDRYDD